MFSINILIICQLLIINLKLIESKSHSLSDNKRQNKNKSENSQNINITCEECLKKSIYLPEYQNKYSRINELNDTNFNFLKIKSNRSVTLVPEDLIDGNEKLLEIEKIGNIINTIEKSFNYTNKNNKIKNDIYTDDYSFYSDSNSFYNNYENFQQKFIKKNTLIYERSSSSIKDIISTNPEIIKIKYEICKPKTLLFKIINPNLEENLIIKSIKSDLYQVKIFPYISNKNNEKDNHINNNNEENLIPTINEYLEHSIYPKTTFVFQLLFLLDHKTTIKGTLYIEFNEKKILLVPIYLIGIENIHRISPIYSINYQVKKLFYVPVEIFNPTAKSLMIKEIIHSFEKIKVYWPNGELFNNNSSVSDSMLKIEPMSKKKIFFLKYYSTKLDNEYGFIHIRTEKNVIVIPVLINLVNIPISTYPKFLNFGLCDVTPKSRNNFIRMIPLKILNDGIDYIKLGKVYIDYDELFLQFHQNFGGENIVLKPNEEVLYGYVIFNGNLEKNLEKLLFNRKNFFGKITKKSIFIETNNTYNHLVEVEYSYLSYINNELQEITGNIQKIPENKENMTFSINVKYKNPCKLRIYNSVPLGDNITIYSDKYLKAKIQNPINVYQTYNSNIIIEIEKLSKFRTLHYYFLPLMLNNFLFSIIPLQIDNNDLTKIFCGNEDNSRTLSICLKNLKNEDKISTIKGPVNKKKIFYINFGDVPLGEKRQKFIYLLNRNEEPIPVNNIYIDYNNFYIDFEGYEYFGNENEPSNIKYPKKGEILEKFRNEDNNESISFKIYPNTGAKFSINLITNENEDLNRIKSSITIYYGQEYKIILSLNATIYKGNINLSPVIYKFEPSFPGLYQKKIIYTKSSFNFPLNILSVTSSDERIIPQNLTNIIYPKNKTALIEVNFDPSKTYFIKEDLNQFELNMSNILTYRELYLWKAKEKFFNKLGCSGRTEINANVTITTTIDKGDINFKSFLIKPNIAKKEEIDFGLIQTGKSMNTYIEGINPSDKMLLIKLILANDNFGDVNNNSMFDEKDRNLLEKNNDLIIFGCKFLFIINGTTIIKSENIVVPEKIDPLELRKGTFDKKDLIRILLKYGNDKIKKYLYNAKNIFCKYDKKVQNEIIFNKNSKNNYLISHIYSNEFNKEIPSVKNMTLKNIEEDNQYKFVEKKSFFNSIISFLANLYLKYFMNVSICSNINIIEHSQSFFIPIDIQEKVYQVPPHKKFSIGPIIFKPNKKGNINGTLFLKNNLTILYPLKLKGEGGSGNIKFIDNCKGKKELKCKIYEENNFIIEIDENIYEKEIKGIDKLNRTITLINNGNLPMTIKNITIDNSNECQTSNMRIVQCKEFILNPQEIIDIDIEIIPNYRYNSTNKIISFNTEYQSFFLNVFIIFSKDFFETQNHIRIFLKCLLIVTPIVAVMLYSLSKIINIFKKQRREMCDNNSMSNDDMDKKENLLNDDNDIMIGKSNENEQLEYNNINNNYNYQSNKNKQKQGKKKRNRKKSNSSNNQKDEIEILSHNSSNKKENQNKLNNNTNNNENNQAKEENRNENNNENVNKIDNQEKNNENKNKIINNRKNELNEKEKKEEIENKENKNQKENKIPVINIPKQKKRKLKGSLKIVHKNENKEIIKEDKFEKEILSDRIEFKREKNEENISEEQIEKKSKEKKISSEQRIKSNENKKRKKSNEIEGDNETTENNNNYNYNYYNKSYQYKNRKGRRDINKKYYPNNRKYNYENNQSNNMYNNNYNYQQQQQPKKQITKIKKENNAKNLKELFEIEHKKEAKEVEIKSNSNKKIKEKNEEKKEKENIILINNNSKNTANNSNKNINNIINDNNISNIKSINDEGIEDDFDDEIFGNKKQKEIFDYNLPIIKKMNGGTIDKSEEMNPTFLNDIKTNNAFEAEQELLKSFKKENKDISNNGELSKEDIDMDLSNSNSHFNFDYYFFEQQQQTENEEPEYSGNYEDYKYKSILDNLNNIENPFINEEQKSKLDLLLSNKEESEDKKDECEEEEEESFKEKEYEQYLINKNKFDNNFNYNDYKINYDNENEDKKFQNKLDEYQKAFEKMWKK